MAFFNVVSHVLMSKRREKKSEEETNGKRSSTLVRVQYFTVLPEETVYDFLK